MNTANKIKARLKKAEEENRKFLTIPFKMGNVEKLDQIARTMTRFSGVTTTRNMIIEEAVESYIEEAAAILEEEGIDWKKEKIVAVKEEEAAAFDTVVFPAKKDAQYQRTFFEEHEWKYVRRSKDKIPFIRWIAIYVGDPQSAISQYAEVEPDGFILGPEGKYRIRLKGKPMALPHPIPLGRASGAMARSIKYTTRQKLFTAKDLLELYKDE